MRHGGKRGFLGKQQRPTPSLLFLLRGKDRGRDRRYLFLGRSQRDVRRRVQVVSERPDLLSVPAVHSLRHWSSAASYRRSSHKNVFWFTSQCLIWCSLVCKNTAAKTESALTQTHEWRAEHMKLHQVTGFYCRNPEVYGGTQPAAQFYIKLCEKTTTTIWIWNSDLKLHLQPDLRTSFLPNGDKLPDVRNRSAAALSPERFLLCRCEPPTKVLWQSRTWRRGRGQTPNPTSHCQSHCIVGRERFSVCRSLGAPKCFLKTVTSINTAPFWLLLRLYHLYFRVFHSWVFPSPAVWMKDSSLHLSNYQHHLDLVHMRSNWSL